MYQSNKDFPTFWSLIEELTSSISAYLGLTEHGEQVSLTESLADSLTAPCLPDPLDPVIVDTAQPHHHLPPLLAVHRHKLHCHHLTVPEETKLLYLSRITINKIDHISRFIWVFSPDKPNIFMIARLKINLNNADDTESHNLTKWHHLMMIIITLTWQWCQTRPLHDHQQRNRQMGRWSPPSLTWSGPFA